MTTTSPQVRGLKRRVFQEFHDFLPRFDKENEVFKSAIIQDVDHSRTKKKGKDKEDKDEPLTWPKPIDVLENSYSAFLERVVNSKHQFYPQKDEDNRAIPNTGAYRTVRSIVRIKRADDSEFLLSKGDIHAFDSLGDEVKFYISYPEKWTRTLFTYKTEWNDKTKQLEKKLEGPSGSEIVYDLPFTKENVTELWNQRESDKTIQFVVKEEETGKAMQVRDLSGSASKSFELFRDSSWLDLFKANYIPAVIKQELRAEAVSQGLIQGGAGDYQSSQSPQTGSKSLYK
jgi:hypothetical protein